MSFPTFLPTPSAEGIASFRQIYQERCGRWLTEAQAHDLASRYLLLYALGTTPVDKPVDKPAASSTMKPPKP